MKNAKAINKNLFDIYLLFTREPFVRYLMRELEFYQNNNKTLLGFISLDYTDKDYYACILSRDKSMQYRAQLFKDSIITIEEARLWIDENIESDKIVHHDNKYDYFDVFVDLDNLKKLHPHFKLLKQDKDFFSSAKEVISEISYHYKDIDGNFIDQFQSLNGFDSRVWELFLFCFFREQYFSFKRNHNTPDYLIEKLGDEIAVEAVIVSRKTEFENIIGASPKSLKEIEKELSNDVPLMFGSAIFDKTKKKYWKKSHVKGKPFIIAIADFHDTMSMTWSSSALSDYLYGYKYEHSFDEKGKLIITPIKLPDYQKKNGTKIPAGFFFQPGNEFISAIIFSSVATLSKFNRMGRQAGLGNRNNIMIRYSMLYNHDENAVSPIPEMYIVDENCNETWSEGTIIFHNPNAKNVLNKNLFDERVAQCFFEDGYIKSYMPIRFPYNSITYNNNTKIYNN